MERHVSKKVRLDGRRRSRWWDFRSKVIRNKIHVTARLEIADHSLTLRTASLIISAWKNQHTFATRIPPSEKRCESVVVEFRTRHTLVAGMSGCGAGSLLGRGSCFLGSHFGNVKGLKMCRAGSELSIDGSKVWMKTRCDDEMDGRVCKCLLIGERRARAGLRFDIYGP